ncbi:MAG: 2-oxo-4-hydroxy-4-carboxy-5-ureidoimidazoline decarboxylase [Sneathiellales bacterium]|nr:2-oxo-4-hydroxy-4-carboxy-5-ureidoimidazoline decarboxylase [Sneathiellales bacterium]
MGADQKKIVQLCADFVNKYCGIYYEPDNHWITLKTFENGGFQTADELSVVMKSVVQNAPREQQIALLNAYPALSYKIRELNSLSDNSRSEQMGVGLDQCSPGEGRELEELNTRYKKKYGFPFIIAVRGVRNRYEILAAMRERIKNDRETEFQTALTQIHKIAGFRLSDMDYPVSHSELFSKNN